MLGLLVRITFAVGLLTAATAGAQSPAAAPDAAEPWLAGPFVAGPAAVARAAARSEAAGSDVLMLFRDERFTLDDDGRMTHRRHWVYRVLTSVGLEDWGASEVRWAPWHQARPRLRARVVDAGGGERWLDPEAIRDLSAEQAGLEGELRLLRARLPVAVGAVVEEEVVVRDTRPLFAAGVSVKHLLAMPVPIRRGRLTLAVPAALPLRYRVRSMSLTPRRGVAAGRVTLSFDHGELPAAGPVAAGLPPEEPRHPHVAFSTGESWAAVAGAYSRAVDELVTESEARAVRRWLPDRGASAEFDRVADVLEGLRGNARHRPSALTAMPLQPSAPLATLRRGGGDSKDLAVVLAAALSAEGIPASVALLRAGFDMDVDPELPGLGRFNHALVYLPARRASSEPTWIDPGDRFSRAGELASHLQGRLALVADPDTRALVRTPVASAADNRTTLTIEVFMAEDGPGRVVETSTHFGAAEHRQRLLTSQVDAARRRLGYQAYLETAYRAEALGELEETGAADLSAAFRLRLEALRAGRAWTADDEGALAIDLRSLVATLPRELLIAGGDRRRRDFVFHEPFVTEWRYRIHLPAGMVSRALPEDLSRPLGSGRLTRTFGLEGRVVRADFRLDSGPRRIAADRFYAFRDAAHELLREQTLVLWFDRGRRR